jgi:hypothetical protein
VKEFNHLLDVAAQYRRVHSSPVQLGFAISDNHILEITQVNRKSGAILAVVLASGLWSVSPAIAGKFRLGHKIYQYEQSQLSQYADEAESYGNADYPVSPAEAANIARSSWPGAKVLRVQLLPSGVYAVTLKQHGEVSRVLVDATSGSIV